MVNVSLGDPPDEFRGLQFHCSRFLHFRRYSFGAQTKFIKLTILNFQEKNREFCFSRGQLENSTNVLFLKKRLFLLNFIHIVAENHLMLQAILKMAFTFIHI